WASGNLRAAARPAGISLVALMQTEAAPRPRRARRRNARTSLRRLSAQTFAASVVAFTCLVAAFVVSHKPVLGIAVIVAVLGLMLAAGNLLVAVAVLVGSFFF